MKKIVSAVLALMLSLSLAACSFRPADPAGTPETTGESQIGKPETDVTTAVTSEATEAGTSSDTSAPGDTEAPPAVQPVIPTPVPGAPKHIVIDAGHGYTDPGCTTEYLGGKYEREIVAEFALELKAVLEERGYEVTLIRDDNRYVTAEEIAAAADLVGLTYLRDKLEDDGRFAAYNRAVWTNVLHREKYMDMFLSLHIDSFNGEDVRGTRVYYCGENDFSPRSETLCKAMTEKLAYHLPEQNTRYFATGWDDGFAVTKHVQMPSALIEMGFASNKEDAENILDPEWRESFAVALADAADSFFG